MRTAASVTTCKGAHGGVEEVLEAALHAGDAPKLVLRHLTLHQLQHAQVERPQSRAAENHAQHEQPRAKLRVCAGEVRGMRKASSLWVTGLRRLDLPAPPPTPHPSP